MHLSMPVGEGWTRKEELIQQAISQTIPILFHSVGITLHCAIYDKLASQF